jgi:hypothetical protein
MVEVDRVRRQCYRRQLFASYSARRARRLLLAQQVGTSSVAPVSESYRLASWSLPCSTLRVSKASSSTRESRILRLPSSLLLLPATVACPHSAIRSLECLLLPLPDSCRRCPCKKDSCVLSVGAV